MLPLDRAIARCADRAHGARARDGFSMVEILGVIVILGLMATIVSINWRAILPKSELTSSVRILASTLASTRSEAIGRNAIFRIEYDLDRHRFRQNTPFKNDGQGKLAATEEDRLVLNWIELPESVRFSKIVCDGVVFDTGIVAVRFDPLGAASGHTITLIQKPYDTYYTVEVQALTGLIEYHEGLFERAPAQESDFD